MLPVHATNFAETVNFQKTPNLEQKCPELLEVYYASRPFLFMHPGRSFSCIHAFSCIQAVLIHPSRPFLFMHPGRSMYRYKYLTCLFVEVNMVLIENEYFTASQFARF